MGTVGWGWGDGGEERKIMVLVLIKNDLKGLNYKYFFSFLGGVPSECI